MAMAIRSPQMYPATSPRMPHGTPAHTSRPASHDAGLPTPSRPALHDAGLPTPGTARMPQRRKSVDFVRQVEVRDYEVEPFDFSDSADCTDKGAGQASPQLSALTESPRMQPLKPEGPVGPVPSAPRLLQRPTIRSPRLPVQTPRLPVSSPPFSPAGPQSSSVTPEMLPWSREPHEPPPMESTDVGIAEQRLNLNRSPGHEALMFESAQMAQREVQRLIEEETMRMEWEGQQPVQNGGFDPRRVASICPTQGGCRHVDVGIQPCSQTTYRNGTFAPSSGPICEVCLRVREWFLGVQWQNMRPDLCCLFVRRK